MLVSAQIDGEKQVWLADPAVGAVAEAMRPFGKRKTKRQRETSETSDSGELFRKTLRTEKGRADASTAQNAEAQPESHDEASDSESTSGAAQLMTNTARIDVFRDEDVASSPEFIQNVLSHTAALTLYPGDVLYIPCGWWHAMRSVTRSASISFWF